MRLIALNGHSQPGQPWRGALVVKGRARSGGALLDPTGAVSARLLVEPELRRRCGLDRPSVPVLLTRAQPDQIAALIELRHGNPVDLYTTPALFESLASLTAIWSALQAQGRLHWRMVPLGGDQARARFHVEGQVGVRYTAWAPEADREIEGQPLVLIIRDESSGLQVAWVHGSGAALSHLSGQLDPWLPDLQWVATDASGPDEDAALDWLQTVDVPHRLLLGGSPSMQQRARSVGVVCAADGLEILVE